MHAINFFLFIHFLHDFWKVTFKYFLHDYKKKYVYEFYSSIVLNRAPSAKILDLPRASEISVNLSISSVFILSF